MSNDDDEYYNDEYKDDDNAGDCESDDGNEHCDDDRKIRWK